jgi:hypothetical protein
MPLPCLFLFLKSNTNPVSFREAESKRLKESMISTPQKGSFLCGKGYKAQPQAETEFLCNTRYPLSGGKEVLHASVQGIPCHKVSTGVKGLLPDSVPANSLQQDHCTALSKERSDNGVSFRQI